MNRLASQNRKPSPSSRCTNVVWVPWCFSFSAIKYGEADGLWLDESIKRCGILRWKVPLGFLSHDEPLRVITGQVLYFLIYLKCVFLSTSKMRKTSGFWAEPHKQCYNYLLACTVLLQSTHGTKNLKDKSPHFFSQPWISIISLW